VSHRAILVETASARPQNLPARRTGRRGLGDAAIHVDFTRVRQFNYFAVAILAQALTCLGAAPARVSGLRLHQVRMLRYFGVGPEVFWPAE
jgi:hypothetical protein